MNKKEYAMFLNGELVKVGTAKQLAKELGIRPRLVPYLTGNGLVICEIDDDDER